MNHTNYKICVHDIWCQHGWKIHLVEYEMKLFRNKSCSSTKSPRENSKSNISQTKILKELIKLQNPYTHLYVWILSPQDVVVDSQIVFFCVVKSNMATLLSRIKNICCEEYLERYVM